MSGTAFLFGEHPRVAAWVCLFSIPLAVIAQTEACSECHSLPMVGMPEVGVAMMQVRSARQNLSNPLPLQFPGGAHDKGRSPEVHTLSKSIRFFSTPMNFTSLRGHGTAHKYKAAIIDECADVRGCAGGDLSDCSPISSYHCTSSEETATMEGEMLSLKFKARLPESAEVVECGEKVCEACTKYKTCAGPSAATEPVGVKGGRCVHWEYEAPGTLGWFELYIGLYNDEGEKLGSIFERAAKSPWAYMQLPVLTDSVVHLRFMLAAYDANGNGTAGSELHLRNPAYGRCLPEECLIRGPETCCYDGDSAPLTEVGYSMLGECCDTEAMTVYIRRVIKDEDMQVCVEGGLEGLVPWFSCDHGLQTLALLRDTLRKTRDGILTPECPWLAQKDNCTEGATPEGCLIPHLPGTSAVGRHIEPKV